MSSNVDDEKETLSNIIKPLKWTRGGDHKIEIKNNLLRLNLNASLVTNH